MSFLGEIARRHVQLDRLIGLGTFDQSAAPQRSPRELNAVLTGALVAILVIGCLLMIGVMSNV